jgi:hypothetical protein
MNAKNWLKLWAFLTIIGVVSLIGFITVSPIPLRFSNSISYDVKLNFIRDTKLLAGANTLVIGSSMALNNIDGSHIESEVTQVEKVANLASWGLQTSEMLQLIKLINLDDVKYVIYATQYLDFEDARRSKIDDAEVKSYLNNEFILSPYVTTLTSIRTNISNYVNYSSIYLNPHKYTYLDYDKTGGINLDLQGKDIDKERWDSVSQTNYRLDEECFTAFSEIHQILKKKGIQFIVLTTPYRKSIMKDNANLPDVYKQYVKKVKALSQKDGFIYFNTQDSLNLEDSYFIDGIHLNKEGARLVSDEIIKRLK